MSPPIDGQEEWMKEGLVSQKGMSDACGDGLRDGVARVRDVGQAVPREGEELADAEEDGQSLFVPSECRQQRQHHEQDDADGREDARLVEHLFDLLPRTHQETRARHRQHVPRRVEEGKDQESFSRECEKRGPHNRQDES